MNGLGVGPAVETGVNFGANTTDCVLIGGSYFTGHTTRSVLIQASAVRILVEHFFSDDPSKLDNLSNTTRYESLNPIGVSAITVGASPYTYTNADGVREAIYIRGGTVSDISKNALTIFTTTPATIWLEPGETVIITYTVVPTMLKDAK
jgi:hypothetical protein